jgi:hypothetical protein
MGNQSSSPTLFFQIIRNKDDAQRILEQAEQRDLYLSECRDNRTNAIARKFCSYSPNYVAFDEEQRYAHVLQESIEQLPLRLRSDLQHIQIIPLMYSADGGMPHTRPYNIICIPNLTQLQSISTLKHELWHIHQRNFQPQWTAIFNKLGWAEYTGTIPASLEDHRRLNPDTVDCPLWIYQAKWIPIPIFTDISHPVLSQVEIWFYHATEQYHVKRIPSSLAIEFPDLPQSAYEHPRELTAYLLAEPNKYRHTPAWSIISSMLPDCE